MHSRSREEEWAIWMRAAIAGDAGAYRRFLEAVTPRVRAMARRRCEQFGASAGDWEDVVQEVLLTIHLDQPALTQAARIDALTRQCRLSQAERHVLMLLADGEPVEATSRHLGLCVSTVRSHVRNLLGKTQAPSLMQLLRWTGSARPLMH